MAAAILIVDDDDGVRSMLRLAFETHGYDVTTAASAAAARTLLASESFDAVLTDMRMESDTAGFDVVRAAAALPRRPPTVILTAYPLLAQQWREMGAAAVLQKPIQMGNLLQTFDRLLAQRKAGA
jgi:DNA-binding NtrC family response regulator